MSFYVKLFLCISGDIGFDGIVLPDAHSELALYAGTVAEPQPAADTSRISLSPSASSGSGNAEAGDREEVPMDVDAVETVKTKSPERSRLLLSTTVVDAAPDDGDDVYDYGTCLGLSDCFADFPFHLFINFCLLSLADLSYASGFCVFLFYTA